MGQSGRDIVTGVKRNSRTSEDPGRICGLGHGVPFIRAANTGDGSLQISRTQTNGWP
jgi:hypothetical protein